MKFIPQRNEAANIRNAIKYQYLILLCIFISFFFPYTRAVDLQCPDSRIRSSPNSSIPLGAGNGTWCCPISIPTLLADDFVMPNDPQYNYSDANGVLYQHLPRCASCPVSSFLSSSWNLCSRPVGTYRVSFCCPTDYTCSTTLSVCLKKNSTEFVYSSNPIYDAAIPTIDVDLCRFHKASNGSLIPGSPCPSQITCEAFSQSQYRCQLCTDSRVTPPGLCNVFTCSRGSFCSNMNELDITSTAKIIEKPCPVGYYCPFNASMPIACQPGELCDVPSLAAPKGCEAGNYCSDSLQQYPCPVGSFCTINTSTPTPCAAGTYCPYMGLSASLECPLGSFCQNSSVAEPCSPGFICPQRNMTAPIACEVPQLCQSANMTAASTCPSRFYCPDTISSLLCPAGSYCPAKVIAPIPCNKGEYNDWPGQDICKICNSRWVTSGEGATRCSVFTSLSIGLICGGVGLVLLLVVVSIIGARFHVKRRKALQLAEEEKRIEEENRAMVAAEIAHHQAVAMDERAKQLMLVAAEQYRSQLLAQETAFKQFQSDRIRIKAELMVRLLRDLRTDVKLHYPHAAALVVPGPAAIAALAPIEEECGFSSNSLTDEQGAASPPLSSTSQQHRDTMSLTLLQQYELFLSDMIEPLFDVENTELWAALNVLAGNPQKCTPIDFNNSLLGMKSLVVESFSTFQSSVEATSLADGSAMQSIIREQLLRELYQHVRAWLVKVINTVNSNAAPPPQQQQTANPRFLPPLNHPGQQQHQQVSTFPRPYITLPHPASVTAAARVMPFSESESPAGSPSKTSGVSLSQSAAMRYLIAASDGGQPGESGDSFLPSSSSSHGDSLPGMM